VARILCLNYIIPKLRGGRKKVGKNKRLVRIKEAGMKERTKLREESEELTDSTRRTGHYNKKFRA
jgi:hypothetical protein